MIQDERARADLSEMLVFVLTMEKIAQNSELHVMIDKVFCRILDTYMETFEFLLMSDIIMKDYILDFSSSLSLSPLFWSTQGKIS